MKDIKKEIQDQLFSLQQGNLYENALSFFETLGYNTQRRNRLANHTFQAFEDTFLQKNEPFSKENALIKDWKSVELLFQLTDNEVRQSISLFQNLEVNNTLIESYLFFAIELKEAHYNRTELSKITREINRIFPMPVMVFFRYGEVVTLAMINRRIHKKDREKDVLEKVTLLKDIFLTENLTHRAHIDILADLQFQHLSKHYNITNFVELHNAWQKVFDIKELNKRFYKELFDWYLWAVHLVKFPKPENEILDDHSHQSISVIRLLTRLIFVWFIKEKKLLNPSLFDTTILANLLNDFKPEDGDSAAYYQGILQNLFFATLNSPMTQDAENEYEKRQFVEDLPTFQGKNEAYNDKSKYRGKELFQKSRKQEIITLLEETPFLNGGLFECLDWRDEVTNKEIRYDGFSVNKDKRAKVPNILFFGKATIDLSKELDDKKRKEVAVKGIIDILKSYKFTIAENTPLEEEIALDPELLGKVFENLLASYNPETQSSARKQTGSFYTPREIVDYMVVESLKAYFAEKLRAIKENALDEVLINKKLQALFSHADTENPFDTETTKMLIEALSDCKILDPACGSGAYPMGVLNTMVYILTKLDPNNLQWKITLQNRAKEDLDTAKNLKDEVIRGQATIAAEHRIQYIEDSFAKSNHELDYTRKLFLIENCIYGVDIQQIAVQISKLRFFISLIVEQKITEGAKNRGILSMPNLETKFVAANTLIGLEKNNTLLSYKVIQTEKALDEKRKEIFFVKRWKDKKKLKEQEKQIREQLKMELKDSGFDEKTATQKTAWNPFDVIHSSPFFDKETMFGEDLKLSFDIVIGNPPYGAKLSEKEIAYFKENYDLKTSESAILFIENGYKQLGKKGVQSYIIPKSFTFASNYDKTRDFVEKELSFIVDCGKAFENVKLEACIISINKGKTSSYYNSIKFNDNAKFEIISSIDKTMKAKFGFFPNGINAIELNIGKQIIGKSIMLNDISNNSRGEMLQKYISTGGKYKVIGGKEIDKYGIRGIKGYINDNKLITEKAKISSNSILAQNIIAHITQPYEHIKIIACTTKLKDYYIIDTINQISITSEEYSSDFIWSLLNSKLLNWYAYLFIFGKAIRTMHFDNAVTSRIPIPRISLSAQQPFIRLVEYILWLKQSHSTAERQVMAMYFERLIDGMVYELYFGEEIKAAGSEFIAYLQNIEALHTGKENSIITALYHKLTATSHPIDASLLRLLNIHTINIIEGR